MRKTTIITDNVKELLKNYKQENKYCYISHAPDCTKRKIHKSSQKSKNTQKESTNENKVFTKSRCKKKNVLVLSQRLSVREKKITMYCPGRYIIKINQAGQLTRLLTIL